MNQNYNQCLLLENQKEKMEARWSQWVQVPFVQ